MVGDELDEEGSLQVVDGLCFCVLGSDDDIRHAYERQGNHTNMDIKNGAMVAEGAARRGGIHSISYRTRA